MPLGVVAFVADLTDKIEQTQEEHGVPRTNIMKYRLRGVCRALPFAYSVKNATGCIVLQATIYLPKKYPRIDFGNVSNPFVTPKDKMTALTYISTTVVVVYPSPPICNTLSITININGCTK